MASSLSIDVFNSGYKSIPGGPGWDDSTPATWPASTSTLISGDRDAVLVDGAPLTTSEGERLAAWVRNTRKQPRMIFVTHGHGDHFFGAGPVLDAFPRAQLMASDQQVVDQARHQTTSQAMASWNSRFARQFSQSPALPALADSPELDLDGHPRRSARSAAPTARSRRSCTCRTCRPSAPATSPTTTSTCGYGARRRTHARCGWTPAGRSRHHRGTPPPPPSFLHLPPPPRLGW